MTDLLATIEKRMASGEPFTFGDLHRGLPEEAYRLADKTIQKWRRKGWIAFVRVGRQTLWGLTDAGRVQWSPPMPNDKQSRAELVESLRSAGDVGAQTTNDFMNLCNEAASAIEALEAENARLREALTPFANAAYSYDPEEGDDAYVAWAHEFTIGSLRRARSALNPERSEK